MLTHYMISDSKEGQSKGRARVNRTLNGLLNDKASEDRLLLYLRDITKHLFGLKPIAMHGYRLYRNVENTVCK